MRESPFNKVMIDIETLDTRPSAVVLSIGATWFNDEGLIRPSAIFKKYLPVQPQLDQGRTVSADTLRWWLDQPIDLFKLQLSEPDKDERLPKILLELQDFILNSYQIEHGEGFKLQCEEVWSNGSFDLTILEHLFQTQNPKIKMPWKYHQTRDLRTLLKFAESMGYDRDAHEQGRNVKELPPHDCLADAIYQVHRWDVVQHWIKEVYPGEKVFLKSGEPCEPVDPLEP